MSTLPAPNLENCDREPIHVPGAIQPHGALLAYDRLGRLSHVSANVQALLGFVPGCGEPFRPEALGAAGSEIGAALRELLADDPGDVGSRRWLEAAINGRSFDVVMHLHEGRAIVEFEARPADDGTVAQFAHLAYRSMDALKRHRTLDRLLAAAVTAVRDITGFDRVMAYRFRHDNSGDVVAEARTDALEAYLGRRYPASDIPAQARRLYTINTLRLIAGIADAPVALLAAPGQTAPLDLSHSVLRSVSPIHVEYLRNMGVHASMSVSIVINGQLWGMIACHHMQPRRVSYPIRMAIDVTAQVIASTVQSLQAKAQETALARAALARTDIGTSVMQGIDLAEVVAREQTSLCEDLRADGLLLVEQTVRLVHGVGEAWAESLAQWLRERDADVVHLCRADELPAFADDVPRHRRICGVLALRFDAGLPGWLVLLRREQIETIRWGGKPDKAIAHGPLGPRLTPRGSFQEWRETVRDTAEPWSEVELEIASQLLQSLSRSYAQRQLEVEQLRSQIWAVIGHDLRGSLHSLTMASHLLDRDAARDRTRSVIRNSTHRMTQLVNNVLDVSRVQQGFALTIVKQEGDLVALVDELSEEARLAHPTVPMDMARPAALPAVFDAGRMAQVVANLLSNARHHGSGDIRLRLESTADEAVLRVSNAARPIPPEVLATLFDPFKRRSTGSARNRNGLGLGLFIADQIVRAHGGSIRYVPEDGRAGFEVRIPLRPVEGDAPGVAANGSGAKALDTPAAPLLSLPAAPPGSWNS